jgi:hypothetical protein
LVIPGMRESDLQAKIITDLELDGWLVIKMMKLNKAGWPDLLAGRNKITISTSVIKRTRFFGICYRLMGGLYFS